MRKIIFILFILSSCATMTKVPTISTGHKVTKRVYYQVEGAGDVLRNATAATIAVWIKPNAAPENNEDIFNISVGGKGEEWKTRAGFRVLKGGAFQSVARTDDLEELSEITTKGNLERPHQWQHVALTIDYTNKKMQFFVDGKPEETLQSVFRFTKAQTADTWSHRVTLGSEDDGRNAFFNGDISNAFVEKRILSRDEIQELMKKTRP